jgi:protein-disulfide isomerase
MRGSADAAVPPRRDAGDMNRRRLVLAASAAAVAAAGILIGVLAFGGGGAKSPAATVYGTGAVARLLNGIPQQGAALGSPAAPVTLVEYADPQCPYCAEWATSGLPGIVERYVRTGKVRIVFNGMAFVGSDSATALRTAVAAGRQNRMWDVLELLFQNQGTENTGWVTEPLLRSIGSAVSGLDVQRMLEERGSTVVDAAIARAAAQAQAAGVNSTPSFAVGKTGETLTLVEVTSLDASGLAPSLDAALAS